MILSSSSEEEKRKWCINIFQKDLVGLSPQNSASKGFTFPVVIDLSKDAMQKKFIGYIHHDLNMHHYVIFTTDHSSSTPCHSRTLHMPLTLFCNAWWSSHSSKPSFDITVCFLLFYFNLLLGITLFRLEISSTALLILKNQPVHFAFFHNRQTLHCRIIKDMNCGIRKVWTWGLP